MSEIKSEALRSLYDDYIRDDPERVASVKQEMENAGVAWHLYHLREKMGLTREELAQRTGIGALVISDLEEADYVIIL
jgi:hypothetical protein